VLKVCLCVCVFCVLKVCLCVLCVLCAQSVFVCLCVLCVLCAQSVFVCSMCFHVTFLFPFPFPFSSRHIRVQWRTQSVTFLAASAPLAPMSAPGESCLCLFVFRAAPTHCCVFFPCCCFVFRLLTVTFVLMLSYHHHTFFCHLHPQQAEGAVPSYHVHPCEPAVKRGVWLQGREQTSCFCRHP